MTRSPARGGGIEGCACDEIVKLREFEPLVLLDADEGRPCPSFHQLRQPEAVLLCALAHRWREARGLDADVLDPEAQRLPRRRCDRADPSDVAALRDLELILGVA